ncbi:hypothetical protein GCM10011390_11780 [Aureimonas endophytica]|uniref:TIGR02186 family protein n=1 Tax=Aureimonas endophytica TaxID=2027858 RepID=A0A917E1D0_9HYPH|nr:TIGR02186 family protein [Aureimonas endophytica]GGD94659.1 hypothetical protein GCM10011390_11780 [Aureimonas endophytica]
MRRRDLLALLVGGAVLAARPGRTEESEPAPGQAIPGESAPGLPEAFEIGLSTEEIVIAPDFSGARLVIFGVLDNADGRIMRQGGYDIVVALEGPQVPIVVREKERTLGLWINQGSERFDTVPASYSLAATRRLGDIAGPQVLSQLSIGIDNLQMSRRAEGRAALPNRDRYAEAVRRIRSDRGLFRESFGTVEFVSATLFRAELQLPADLPVGRHVARAFLFRRGVFLRERTDTLWVVKSGFESTVSNLAHRYGTYYGVFAVALAMATGWLGRMIFKRD